VELDPLPGQQQGRQGLVGVAKMMRTSFPDMHCTIEESIVEGEKVVSRFTWTGIQKGEFLGILPRGKAVHVKGVVIDRVLNGLMTDSRILMDTFGMMQQLGAIPAA